MKLNIKVEDYVTNDELKNIVRIALQDVVRQKLERASLDTLLTNISYDVIAKDIDEKIPDYKEKIIYGIEKCLDKDYQMFHVFRKPDQYDRVGNIGYDIVKAAILSRKQDIQDRVNKEIDAYDPKELITNMFSRAWEDAADKFYGIADAMYNMFKKNE